MAQVSVTLVRADTNQEFDVELPDDAPINELLPALVKELGLPLTGPDGNQVAYELSNKRTGQEYKEAATLGGDGTKTGDVLLLTSTFVAGATATRMTNRQAAAILLEHLLSTTAWGIADPRSPLHSYLGDPDHIAEILGQGRVSDQRAARIRQEMGKLLEPVLTKLTDISGSEWTSSELDSLLEDGGLTA